MLRRMGIFGLTLLTAGCSWKRFDDIEKDTPVAVLEKPEKLDRGFGVTVATASLDGETSRGLVTGASAKSSPAAIYDLGLSDNPQIEAIDTGGCDDEDECYLAEGIAGLGRAETGGGERDLCFVLGVGSTRTADDPGLFARCADATEYTLPVPERALQRLIEDTVLFNEEAEPLVIAADKDDEAAVVAGARNQKLAWFYRPLSVRPIALDPPGERGDGYGAAVASARLAAGTRLLAVGAPGGSRVWLFRAEEGEEASAVGCLGGPSGLGRSLSTGRVDDDDLDDLVLADERNVTVLSGRALAELEPAEDIECTLKALPPGGVVASFSCGSRGTVTGCPGGFATTTEVADLDGDGDGEVLVGAPGLTVRGEERAGALLVYDAEGDRPELLSDVLFISSREKDDRLGAALATAELDARDVPLVGAPGGGRAAVFYCSSLVPDSLRGNRCD